MGSYERGHDKGQSDCDEGKSSTAGSGIVYSAVSMFDTSDQAAYERGYKDGYEKK